jgi:hypothetical protein
VIGISRHYANTQEYSRLRPGASSENSQDDGRAPRHASPQLTLARMVTKPKRRYGLPRPNTFILLGAAPAIVTIKFTGWGMTAHAAASRGALTMEVVGIAMSLDAERLFRFGVQCQPIGQTD